MCRLLLILSVIAGPLSGWNQEDDIDVNSRYTVEAVDLTGIRPPALHADLRKDVDSVIGQLLDYGVPVENVSSGV